MDNQNQPEGFRISTVQQRLLQRQPLGHHSVNYCAYVIEGPLALTQYGQGWSELVTQHEILRTVLQPLQNTDTYVQLIAQQSKDQPNFTYTVQPALVEMPAGQQLEALFDDLPVTAQHSCQVVVYPLVDNKHLIIIACSAVLLDTESMDNLFAQSLTDQVIDEESILQYADYCEWAFELSRQESSVDGTVYWQNQRWQDLVTFKLPWDHPRAGQTGRSRQTEVISEPVATKLTAMANKWGCGTEDVLLAAWQSLLCKISDTTHAVTEVRNHGRNIEELAETVGLYAGYLPMWQTLAAELEVKEAALGCFATRETASTWFEYLDDVRAKEELNSVGLRYGFSFFAPMRCTRGDLTAYRIGTRECTGFYHLEMAIEQVGQQFSVTLDVDQGFYASDNARLVLEQFGQMLTHLANATDSRVGELNCLGERQKQAMLSQFNPAPQSAAEFIAVAKMFEYHVEQAAQNVALQCDGQALSYADFNGRANKLAHHLLSLGVGKETLVAIHLPRSINLMVALFAVMKSGGAFLLLDPEYPQQRLQYIVEDADVHTLICQNELVELVTPSLITLNLDLCDESVFGATACAQNPDVTIAPDQLAYLIYTSGSTGQPKGVMIEQGGFSNYVQFAQQRYQLNQGSGAPVHSSVAFDATITSLVTPLTSGCCVDLLDVTAPVEKLHQALQQGSDYSLVKITPAHMAVLAHHDLSALKNGSRCYVIGGEALNPATIEPWLTALPQVTFINEYGPTETVVGCSIHQLNATDDLSQGVPIGRPINNSQMYILDESMAPVPLGFKGEIYIGGSGVARGYYNKPELTAAQFVRHPFSADSAARLYKSGDLGRMGADGTIEFLGRCDDQVKIRGYRIELGEIESQIGQLPQVQQAVVVAPEFGDNDKRIVAYITGDDGLNGIPVKEALKRTLPQYMIPAHIEVVDELPMTQNGKIDRAALSAKPPTGSGCYTGPNTALEKQLCAIWAEILKAEKVGIHDNFFELGGHSLLAAQLVARIQNDCACGVTLDDLFTKPTIHEMAQHINTSGQGTVSEVVLPKVEADLAGQFEHFGLTDVQYAYWIGRSDVYELGNVASHAYFEKDLPELDVAQFNHAWNVLIARHPMLRTIITEHGMQKVLPQVPPLTIALNDLAQMDQQQQHKQLMDVREEMSHQLLAVDTWPLFEIRLNKLSSRAFRVHMSMDALITDAFSAQILLKELLAVYFGKEDTLAPLDLTFRDYLLASQQLKSTPVYAQSKAYWQARIDDLPGAPNLPMVKSPSDIDKPLFKRREFVLPEHLWQGLQRNVVEYGITPSVVLASAYAKVIAKWTESQQFVLNLTLFNRLPVHEQVNHILGDFTSLTLLAFDFCQPASFKDTCRTVQRQLWQDLEHKYFSGIEVIREITRVHGSKRAAMPVVFTSALAVEVDEEAAKLVKLLDETGESYSITQTPQVWLDHQVTEQNGKLVLSWDAVEELFPEGLLDDMFAAYCDFVTQIAQSPKSWLTPVPIKTPESQLLLRKQFNDVEVQFKGGLLHDGFINQANQYPERLALCHHDRQFTYGQLHQYVVHLAHALRDEQVKPNELVAIVMHKGWEQVVAALAISLSGAAYLPIDAALPEQRINQLLESGKVKVVVVQDCTDTQTSWSAGKNKLVLNEQFQYDGPLRTLEAVQQVSDLAYVIFTSGSTGMPKGVMIDHLGAVNTIEDINQKFKVNSDDAVLALSSLSFDLSVYDIFGLLSVGGTIVVPQASAQNDPSVWLSLVQQHNITIWNSVPALVQMFTEYAQSRYRGDSLRLTMMSGDWIPVTLPQAIKQTLSCEQVISLGGATEASIWSIYYPIDKVAAHWSSIPYGKPLANQRFHVLDKQLNACPDWVAGDLYIAGMGLAKGYWQDKDKTDSSFFTHPQTGERLYKTGDMGKFRCDGNIEFLGRLDGQVKVQGYRIELGEVEAHLLKHPQVDKAVVEVFGDLQHRRLVAYFVVKNSHATAKTLDGDVLKAFVAQLLPAYMLPSVFVPLDAIPYTANGKVDRKALPKTDLMTQQNRVYQAPSNPTEKALVEIWQQVLTDDSHEQSATELKVGIEDNFFEIGGNSLLVIQIAAQIRQRLGKEVKLGMLLTNPTIAALAAVVDLVEVTVDTFVTDVATIRRAHDASQAGQDNIRYPLSLAQKSLWFVSQLQQGSTVYNTPISIRISGELNPQLLQQSLHSLIDAHESLRTTFPNIDGEPFQRVHLQRLANVTIEHLTTDGEQAIAQRLHQLAVEDTEYQFDLVNGPLFKARILSFGHQQHALFINMHHIINDHISIDLMLGQVLKHYQSAQLGLTVPIPNPLLQYVDYSLWQNDALVQDKLVQQLRFWQSQLMDIKPLNLPFDKQADNAVSYVGETLEFQFDAALSQQLKTLAAQNNTTLFAVVLSGYYSMLSYLCDQDDIVIGTPVSTRANKALQEVVGLFLNTIMLRVVVDKSASFADLLQSVRDKSVEALDHIDLPSEKVVASLADPRSNGQSSSLYQARFVYRDNQRDSIELDGLKIAAVEEVRSTTKFDLMLTVNDTNADANKGLQGNIEYRSTLFNKETIENMVQTFKLILQEVASVPGQTMQSLFDTLTCKERQRRVSQKTAHQGSRLAGLKALKNKGGQSK